MSVNSQLHKPTTATIRQPAARLMYHPCQHARGRRTSSNPHSLNGLSNMNAINVASCNDRDTWVPCCTSSCMHLCGSLQYASCLWYRAVKDTNGTLPRLDLMLPSYSNCISN